MYARGGLHRVRVQPSSFQGAYDPLNILRGSGHDGKVLVRASFRHALAHLQHVADMGEHLLPRIAHLRRVQEDDLFSSRHPYHAGTQRAEALIRRITNRVGEQLV